MSSSQFIAHEKCFFQFIMLQLHTPSHAHPPLFQTSTRTMQRLFISWSISPSRGSGQSHCKDMNPNQSVWLLTYPLPNECSPPYPNFTVHLFFHERMEMIVNFESTWVKTIFFFMPPFSSERHSRGEGFYSKNITIGLIKLWWEQGFSESEKGNVADSTLTLEMVAPELQLPLVLLCRIKRKHDVDFVCERSRLCLCWDHSKS